MIFWNVGAPTATKHTNFRKQVKAIHQKEVESREKKRKCRHSYRGKKFSSLVRTSSRWIFQCIEVENNSTRERLRTSVEPLRFQGNQSVSCVVPSLFCGWSSISWEVPLEDSLRRWRLPEAAVVSPLEVPRWSVAPEETPTRSLFPRHWIDSVAKSVETKENPYRNENLSKLSP